MKTITKKDILIILLLFSFAIISRYIFSTDRGNYFGIDPTYLALGATDYSIINDRPHLPGYILHIESIKLLSTITGDHSISMIWLSILYSSVGIVLIYLIFRKWFNPLISVSYSLLLITNPLVWFYGCVPEIYAFDLLFSSAIILCGLSGRMIFLTPILLSLGTGVRQSSGVLLLPIYLFFWIIYYKKNKPGIKYIFITHVIAVILFLSWFIPMANSAGGLKEYIALYGTHYAMKGRAAFLGFRLFIINQIGVISFGYTVFLPLIYPVMKWFINSKAIKDKQLMINDGISILKICFWWVMPILVFFIFYHYNKGYILIILPGIFLFLAYLIRRTNISGIYIISILAVQIVMFIYFPHVNTSDEVLFSPEKRSISKFDVWLERLQGPYLMSYGTIQKTNDGFRTIKNGMSYCNELISDNKYKGYFISSTAHVVPNTLHVLYPQIKIYYFHRGSEDKYYECFSIDITKKEGFADMIKHSVIITSGSFYEKYLLNLCKPIYKNDNIIFSVIFDGQQENFSKLYLELF